MSCVRLFGKHAISVIMRQYYVYFCIIIINHYHYYNKNNLNLMCIWDIFKVSEYICICIHLNLCIRNPDNKILAIWGQINSKLDQILTTKPLSMSAFGYEFVDKACWQAMPAETKRSLLELVLLSICCQTLFGFCYQSTGIIYLASFVIFLIAICCQIIQTVCTIYVVFPQSKIGASSAQIYLKQALLSR